MKSQLLTAPPSWRKPTNWLSRRGMDVRERRLEHRPDKQRFGQHKGCPYTRSEDRRVRRTVSIRPDRLFSPLATHDCVYVIGHVMPLLDAIEDHALGDGDHFWNEFVQDADDRTFVAAVRVRV